MKYFTSSILGLLSGVFAILFFEFLFFYLFPLPNGIPLQNSESLAQNMADLPLLNLLLVIASYAIGSIIAGFVSAKIKTPDAQVTVLIIGFTLTVAGFYNFLTIAHPLWMIIVGSITFIPMTWLGNKIGTPSPKFDTIFKV